MPRCTAAATSATAGMVFTEPIAAHGYPQSLRLMLPALSCLLLKPLAEGLVL